MDKMNETIMPKAELPRLCTCIFTMQISTDKIRDVIGPG